jgi:hypothetical protein
MALFTALLACHVTFQQEGMLLLQKSHTKWAYKMGIEQAYQVRGITSHRCVAFI